MKFPFFEMEPHIHKEMEIMYVAGGSCHVSCWDKHRECKEYILKEGEYIVVDGEVLHMLTVKKGTPCRMLNLEIGPSEKVSLVTMQLLEERSEAIRYFLTHSGEIYIGNDSAGQLHSVITRLQTQLQSNTDLTENHIGATLILAELILILARQCTKKQKLPAGNLYLKRAIQCIEANYDQELHISSIAKEAGISEAYLQRLFKAQTGSSIVEKINEYRIEKAKLLLETSSLPIVDIAVSVGFNNRQHFSYTFSRLTGYSPADYRKHNNFSCKL